jgi:hypothetical protein
MCIVCRDKTFQTLIRKACYISGVPRKFFREGVTPGIFFGGVQQIQLRTQGRENGYIGALAP